MADAETSLQLTGALGRVRSRDGDIRVPVRVAFVDKPLKGFRFSRQALEGAIPDFVGNTISIGDHNDQPRPDWSPGAPNPVVGKIRSGYIDEEDGLCLVGQFDQARLKPALAKRGLKRIEDLPGEVSVDTVIRPLAEPDEDGVTPAVMQYTQGFVVLTDEVGACSRADGCGLQLSASANCCNSCKEKHMAEQKGAVSTEDLKEAFTAALSPISDLLKAQGETLTALQAAQTEAQARDGDEGKGKGKGDGTEPSAEVVELREAKEAAEAKLAEIEKAKKDDVINGLVKTDHYEEDDREKLSAVDLTELQERLRILSPADSEETDEQRVAASKGGKFSFSNGKAPKGANTKGGATDEEKEPKAPLSWEEQCAQMWNRPGSQEATN